MHIDRNAPLAAKKETVITAPIEHVWKLLSDIEEWPTWQKEIYSTELQGTLSKGTVFKWKTMGMTIVSELQEVTKNRVIGWTGKSFGSNAKHIWKLEQQGSTTKVVTEESLSGWLPTLIKVFKPNFLEETLSKSLNTLKTQAEST